MIIIFVAVFDFLRSYGNLYLYIDPVQNLEVYYLEF